MRRGAYFSSLDADSAGEEGAYYAWSYVEILTLLGDSADLFIEFYNISIDGNWEADKNILFQTESRSDKKRRPQRTNKDGQEGARGAYGRRGR